MTAALLPPMIPIDRITATLIDLNLIRSKPIREQHGIETIPTRTRNNHAVESKEIGGVRYVLGSAIFTIGIARRIDAQSIEAREISEPKRLARCDLEPVREPLALRWKYGLERQKRMDFRDGATAFERSVKHVETAVTPAASRWVSEYGIASVPDDAPYRPRKSLPF